jgi:large subunit ribosomal protein L9
MKVILLQDVAGLGKAGDLKEVANGYARNYLLPRQMAAGATPALISNREQRVAAEKRKVVKQDESNKQLAERLSQVALTFRARVGSQGRLYGSITSQDIATALRDAEGISIDRRTINLEDPIRTVGTFNVPVRVASGLERALTVKVVDESTPIVAGEKTATK